VGSKGVAKYFSYTQTGYIGGGGVDANFSYKQCLTSQLITVNYNFY
jgi:hypothetical protein